MGFRLVETNIFGYHKGGGDQVTKLPGTGKNGHDLLEE